MGELLHEIEQLAERGMVYLHGHMLEIEHDAVLIIINIGRILEAPLAAVNRHGDDAVVLSGRMVDPARVALILPAEQALGIAGLLRVPGGGDGLGVLLRLGQIDGDVQIAVPGGRNPYLSQCGIS